MDLVNVILVVLVLNQLVLRVFLALPDLHLLMRDYVKTVLIIHTQPLMVLPNVSAVDVVKKPVLIINHAYYVI